MSSSVGDEQLTAGGRWWLAHQLVAVAGGQELRPLGAGGNGPTGKEPHSTGVDRRAFPSMAFALGATAVLWQLPQRPRQHRDWNAWVGCFEKTTEKRTSVALQCI